MIRFEVTLPREARDYIRHARVETLRAIRVDPKPVLVDPLDHGVYTIAFDADARRPVGLSECYFQHDMMDNYEELPYGSVDGLAELCPFHLLSGIRTLYVEPEYRVRHPLFLHLCLCAAYVFRTMGGRYATATTDAANAHLAALYDKLGGTRLGTFNTALAGSQEIALYVFDLEAMASHRAMDRLRSRLAVDFHLLHAARRGVWSGAFRAASDEGRAEAT